MHYQSHTLGPSYIMLYLGGKELLCWGMVSRYYYRLALGRGGGDFSACSLTWSQVSHNAQFCEAKAFLWKACNVYM